MPTKTDQRKQINNFIDSFSLPRNGFVEPVAFTDEFGFSTQKDRLQNGFSFTSIYKFFIDKRELENDKSQKSVIVMVSYGEKRPDGSVVLAPTSIKRKFNWPIDFISTDEFFYDIEKNKFFYKSSEIDAKDVLSKVEVLHLKPTRPISGFWLRIKLFFWRSFVTFILITFRDLLITILYCISGVKTKINIWSITSRRDSSRDRENLQQKESFSSEKINIFGYQASAWSVVAYSTIHLLMYTAWYFTGATNIKFLLHIFQNNFLIIVYVIPTLVIFEKLVPMIIEKSIVLIGEVFRQASFKKVNLSY